MINKEVCEYFIKNIDATKTKFYGDLLVKEGYGQTSGDNVGKRKQLKQVDHFLKYYGTEKRNMNKPSYANLQCPELTLFIAEAAGLKKSHLDKARDIIIRYETENNLKGTPKKGSYLDKIVLMEFKCALKIFTINKIIINAEEWEQVKLEVAKL